MKTIAAAEFKEKCLALLDRVQAEGIVITKHGKPVARLIPFEQDPKALIGAFSGKIRILGDVMTTDESWDANAKP